MSRLVHRLDEAPAAGSLSPGVWGRRGEGPVRARCRVLRRERVGTYVRLTFAAPAIAARAQPGQFVEIAVETPGAVLRRPFSIHRTTRPGAGAGIVEIILDAHGPGTQWLASVPPDTILDVVGPLGTPFESPPSPVACLLVGGGYGAAALFFLSDMLRHQGLRVDMIVGASTQDRLFDIIETKRVTASVTFTTDDGSFGTPGRVSDVFTSVAAAAGTGMVYACGPMPMLRAVSLASVAVGLPSQVAVEEHMACGTGVCWTCVVPVADDEGVVHHQRSCFEGPVFDGASIAWGRTRWSAPRRQEGPA